MAVIIHDASAVEEVFQSLGEPGLIDELKKSKIKVSLGFSWIQASHGDLKLDIKLPVPVDELKSPATDRSLKTDVINRLRSFQSLVEVVRTSGMAIEKAASGKTSSTPPVNPPKVDLDKPVPISQARYMYQAVKGTNHVYRLVAIGEKYRVAVRLSKSGKEVKGVSFRVHFEGEDYKSLIPLGFLPKSSYASLHLALTHTTAAKLIGAVLMSIGDKWKTPFPEMDKLSTYF